MAYYKKRSSRRAFVPISPRAINGRTTQTSFNPKSKYSKRLVTAYEKTTKLPTRYSGPRVRIETPPITWPRPPRPKARMNLRVRPVGAGSSFSRYKEYRRSSLMKQIYRRLTPQQTYVRTFSARGASTSNNVQGYNHIMAMLKSDIFNLFSYTAGVTPGNVTTVPTKMMIQKVTIRTMYTNPTNTNVLLDIYEIKCRLETNDSPTTSFGVGLQQEANAASTGQSVYGAANIGVTPFQSVQFCRRYLVRKIYHVELAPGRTHIHNSSYIVNKYVNSSDYDTSAADAVFQKDTSRGIFYVIAGTPLNSVTTKTNVGTSIAVVDSVSTITYTYRYINPSPSQFIIQDSLPTLGATEVINDDGAIITEAAA